MGAAGRGIVVPVEQLQQTATQLQNGAENINGLLTQLANQVAPLGSEWAGDSQQQFMALWEEWQRDGRGLYEALTTISQLMTQAANRFVETDTGIGNTMRPS